MMSAGKKGKHKEAKLGVRLLNTCVAFLKLNELQTETDMCEVECTRKTGTLPALGNIVGKYNSFIFKKKNHCSFHRLFSYYFFLQIV